MIEDILWSEKRLNLSAILFALNYSPSYAISYYGALAFWLGLEAKVTESQEEAYSWKTAVWLALASSGGHPNCWKSTSCNFETLWL